ncbi:S41 family peptidase [Ureibacillus aquaedulcis]|uniref:S41 family peptidase n=1 Tax=Ureibacillus aquaedulcis TaxID=3058421 RepID=A0ABT8GL84_9BACL|nr:S41 family peptidase [Ureibacillus sp. BA0131]MDN4492178.1 S41 family peptidase [Ureibacillus sp. BA0131]
MKRFAPMLFAIILTLSLPFHTYAAILDDVKAIVKSDYVGDINGDLDSAKSIEEVIDMLDPYSDYFSKEEYEAFTNAIDMETVGIGIVIEKHEKGILIVDVINNGSAHSSGFEPGDIITKVNGQPTVEMSVEEAQTLIVGEENSIVEFELLKTNGQKVNEIIKRRSFSLLNVNAKLLYGNVGYISINSFSENAAEEVARTYSSLLEQGATSFIVDLQNNGGGYVVTAEKLIGMFPGATYAYKIQLATKSGLVRANQQGVEFPTKTRLLVNRYSASASEMTAAALLDQHSAILYGESTYGKGTMQTFYELADESILKLTVGEFFGPSGTVVKDVGVAPNIITATNPLYQAHYDSIVENLQNYKELKSLLGVPTTKTFQVNFNKEISDIFAHSSVKLVQLGGSEVDVSLKVSGKQLTVTPTAPLGKGKEYILIVEPTIKDLNGRQMNKGIYLKVTVQ